MAAPRNLRSQQSQAPSDGRMGLLRTDQHEHSPPPNRPGWLLARSPAAGGYASCAFAFRVPRARETVTFVRHELIRWLEESDVVGDEAFEIALACSEACANAVEHPLDVQVETFEVRAEISDRRIEIEVRDFGQWSAASPHEEGGRGLSIIQTLMDGVVIAHGDGGTSVTMWRRRGGIRTPSVAH